MAKGTTSTRIADATGTAGGGDSAAYTSQGIQDAMTRAAEQCADKGIVDPELVLEAKLKAREDYKAGIRSANEKAAKAKK